ncbi:MAG: extracellular solute-binding protein [Firmicutes bacterium]|nr:extracellular solute-binding protein [Bacillota bacterium]
MGRMSRITATAGRRACVIAAACMVLVLSAAGCGRPRSAEVTLRLSMWGDPEEQQRVEEAAKAFEAANPGVEVEVEAAPAMQIAGGITAYEQKLIVLIAAQDAPDIMYLPRERYGFYAEKGALLNLEPFIKESGGEEKLAPGLLDGMRVHGGIYGLVKDGGTVYTISVQTKHPKEAWALLLHIATGAR